MHSESVQVRTGSALVTEVTDVVRRFCHDRGDGLCHLFLPHATAGLALMETGSGSESDLRDAIDRLLPPDDVYRHRHGSRGHGRDHILPTLVPPSLTLPVHAGTPALGTWQSVVVVDTNVDNPVRTLHLSFISG